LTVKPLNALGADDRLGFRDAGYRIQRRLQFNNGENEPDIRFLRQLAMYVEDEGQLEATLLHEVAICGGDMQQALDELGGEELIQIIDQLDATGRAPLHHAAAFGNVEAIDALVKAGADVHRKDSEGLTSLSYSIIPGETDCLWRLLSSGARVNDRASNGKAALHLATARCEVKAVKLLLNVGASVLVRDAVGNTPLHRVGESFETNVLQEVERLAETTQLLLDHGASTEAGDMWGFTPAMRAVTHNKLPFLRHLLAAGASLSCITNSGKNLLHLAARSAEARTLQYLHHHFASTTFRIDCEVLDSVEDSPWDVFILFAFGDAQERAGYRRMAVNEQEAFVDLYSYIRDRNLEHDITLLGQASMSLALHDLNQASAELSKLIMFKQECHNDNLASFYRGIRALLRADQVDAAQSAVDDILRELRETFTSSPWDQPSPYDYLRDEYELANSHTGARVAEEVDNVLS
jgi:ankyrin repeat protein